MVILRQKISYSMESFSEFVTKHENDDIAGLLLSGKFPDNIDPGLAANTIEVRRKMKRKVPSWYRHPELVYPLKLSGEQCSSEATAMYKAALAERIFRADNRTCGHDLGNCCRKPRIADLTGGLGVDSWAFSSVADAVLYNEMNPDLAAAAEANFAALGCSGITVKSFMTVSSHGKTDGSRRDPETGTGHTASREMTPENIIGDFRPDIIFMDPARRSADGSKVFLLEHCSPDVLTLQEELFSLGRYIMLKVSPMADTDMLLKRLGDTVRQLHIMAAGGECKEMLILMDREFHGECTVTAANFHGYGAVTGPGACNGWAEMEFTLAGLRENDCCGTGSSDLLREGALLYEPGKALMKAGAFRILDRRFPLEKLGRFTHYYILDAEASGKFRDELEDFGKFFVICEVLPLDKRSIKETGKKYPEAEVTARNIKMDTDTLRKKLGVSSGDSVHIFGLRCDLLPERKDLLLVTRTCSNRRNSGCKPDTSEGR